jgi:hypothetical protein
MSRRMYCNHNIDPHKIKWDKFTQTRGVCVQEEGQLVPYRVRE